MADVASSDSLAQRAGEMLARGVSKPDIIVQLESTGLKRSEAERLVDQVARGEVVGGSGISLFEDDRLAKGLSLVLGIAAAVGVGALAGAMYHVFFLIIAFPALMGLAVGLAFSLPQRIDSEVLDEGPWLLAVAGVLGMGSYIFARWVSYLIVVNDLPDVDIGFWSYLRESAAAGTEIGRRSSSFFTISGLWAWLLWSFEMVLAGAISLGTAATETAQVFGED